MTQTRRPTQLTSVTRGFGGRSLTDDSRGAGSPRNRAERSTAYSTWADAAYYFQDDEQESYAPRALWAEAVQALVALAVVLFFGGGFTLLILWLATTR